MPTETRILGFNKPEVLVVLKEYCSRTGRELPEGGVDGLDLGQGREVAVKLNSNGQTLEFTESEIAAAIICIASSAAFPWRGTP
jgi:hypothetical protein